MATNNQHLPFRIHNRLMFITHRTERYTECDQIKMAIEGGCSWIQLRMKQGMDNETVRQAIKICNDRGVAICLNDNMRMAIDQGANAVHLGKNDLSLDMATKMLTDEPRMNGQIFHIGATANTFEDIEKALHQHVSYIGLGPYRFTGTKKNLSPLLGIEGYRKIRARLDESDLNIPIFAIGGIRLEDVAPLMRTGIEGIAVSGAIINAKDPVEETRRFINELNKY